MWEVSSSYAAKRSRRGTWQCPGKQWPEARPAQAWVGTWTGRKYDGIQNVEYYPLSPMNRPLNGPEARDREQNHGVTGEESGLALPDGCRPSNSEICRVERFPAYRYNGGEERGRKHPQDYHNLRYECGEGDRGRKEQRRK